MWIKTPLAKYNALLNGTLGLFSESEFNVTKHLLAEVQQT